MDMNLVEEAGTRWIEGPQDQPLLANARDATRIVEACAWFETHDVLLYAVNLPPTFFDLSSGDAGEILQKMQTYGVRLAVVCPPGSVRFSTRFGDVLVEEQLGHYFRVFETHAEAVDWLAAHD
jgi:hypothetical protein